MLESEIQARVIKRLFKIIHAGDIGGGMILKSDASYCQGIPDILILYDNKWAALEIKRTRHAHIQPNQRHYVEKMNNMSYAAFLYPDNEEQIISELIEFFKRRN